MRAIKAFSVLLGIILFTVTAFGQQTKRDEGIDLYRAGKFTEAVSRLAEATAADKMDRQAWLYLAGAYKHLGKDKEAITAFEGSRIIQKTNLPKYDKPVKITSKPLPVIKTDNTGPLSYSASYSVAVELCADGTVGIIIPYTIAFGERNQAIIDAVKKIKFDPAVKDGKPVTVIHVMEYTFRH